MYWILALAALGLTLVAFVGDGDGQGKVMNGGAVIVVAFLLAILWLLLLSRLPWKVRLVFSGALILAGALLSQIVVIRGVTGNLLPILAWRWSPTDGDLAAGPIRLNVGSDKRTTEPPVQAYPQFLGPDRNATLAEVRISRDWSAFPPEELWRQPVGAGWSAFSTAGNRAITQEQHGPDEQVVAYDLISGERLWIHSSETRFEKTIGGVGPRATPTIDGETVFTMGATGRLLALDLATGRALWTRDVLAENRAISPEWGMSGSPLIVGHQVIVAVGGENASLVAYDRSNGAVLWSGSTEPIGYSSPSLLQLAGVEQIVLFGRSSITGRDPETGELLWHHPWSFAQPNVAQPLPITADTLLISSGYGIGSQLLRFAKGPETTLRTELVWESRRLKAKFANPVLHDGYVYGLDDGVLVCLDPSTGERCWKKGRYGHGQLILVDDLLLIQAEDGSVVLVEASPESHNELARIPIFEGKTWNSPAFAAPYLLLRNDREAVCLKLKLGDDH